MYRNLDIRNSVEYCIKVVRQFHFYLLTKPLYRVCIKVESHFAFSKESSAKYDIVLGVGKIKQTCVVDAINDVIVDKFW